MLTLQLHSQSSPSEQRVPRDGGGGGSEGQEKKEGDQGKIRESQRGTQKRWEDLWMNMKFQLVLHDTRQKRDLKKVERLHVSLKNVALKTQRKAGAVICRGPASKSPFGSSL